MRILVGDIGGTNTRLAVFEHADGRWTRTLDRRFESQKHPALEPLVRQVRGAAHQVDAVALGVAGPVTEAGAVVTNLPWVIERAALAEAAGCQHVVLLNDFEAIARSLPELHDDALVSLTPEVTAVGDQRAVLGAGTGLGVALLVGDRVVPTEGGHADFGPRNEEDAQLARHVRAREGRCTVEHLLSGRGLARIYAFTVEAGLERPTPAFAAELAASDDPAATITRARDREPACGRAVDHFVRIYGSEAANVALRCSPFGGLYVAGGIAPRFLERFQSGAFVEAFRDKPPMRAFLERVPISVVTEPDAGLLGARTAGAACLG